MLYSNFIQPITTSVIRNIGLNQFCYYGKISNKAFRSKATNLPGLSTINHSHTSSIINKYLFNQAASKTTFRNLSFCTTYIHNDLRPCNTYWESTNHFHSISNRNKDAPSDNKTQEKSLNLIKKLKQMFKQYWYIYIPVHGITSIIWFGGFYYALKSGFDFKPYLQTIGNFSWLIDSLENSDMGYYAISAALYKIISPVRYTITVGLIAVSVKAMKRMGYIKENDITKEDLQHIYKDKKDELIHKRNKMKENYTKKKFQIIKRYYRKREEIRRKSRKRILYIREIYSRGKKDLKNRNGLTRKNGSGVKHIKSVIKKDGDNTNNL